jgi:hypothetical protein
MMPVVLVRLAYVGVTNAPAILRLLPMKDLWPSMRRSCPAPTRSWSSNGSRKAERSDLTEIRRLNGRY